MKPPSAPRIEHQVEVHGISIDDPYHWLRDPAYPEVTDPQVLEYLKAENAYFEQTMGPHQSLVDTLFEEIKGRQPLEDQSVPYRKDGYFYRWRFEKDAQYRLWERAPADAPERWSVMIDEPALAAEHPYFSLGGFSVSPDGRYLGWSADFDGSERYQLRITDLDTGEVLPETLGPTRSSPVWAADSRTLLYLLVNESWRPYQVRRHVLGTPAGEDAVVYEEPDEGFFVGLGETQSERWLLISTGDHVTSETWLIPSSDPTTPPRLVEARQTGHEYHLDHHEDCFYVLTNDSHRNFRLARTPEDEPGQAHWETVIFGSDERYLTGHLCLKGHLIVSQRVNGLDGIQVRDYHGGSHEIEFPEETYSVDLGANAEYETGTLRLAYESMVTPLTVFDYDLASRALETRKVQQIPSGYDPALYRSERRLAPARDGVHVPVSIVYHRDTPLDGSAPLLLYGYGAYGYAVDPGFSASRLSLLERGWVFAIAHVRGGDDLGYAWYQAGKLDKRTNTFNDFVDVARHLAAERISSPGRIASSGGSAGGELVAAALNQDRALFGAMVAHVPFVDVLNTMLDASLPLTPLEWPEWGNPLEDRQAFEYIRSYSPYDQLAPGAYPPVLVTAGLNDPRVTYWEPAKYVAKLRSVKTDDSWVLLKTNMEAGHRGRSGRFDALQELAEEYAFLLVCLGPAGVPGDASLS